MSGRIRLEGPSPPAPARVSRPARVALLRPQHLMWVAVLGVIAGAAVLFGTPHLRFEYTYTGTRAAPVYSRCVYVGIGGALVRHPANGRCPLVALLHAGAVSP